jgi:membrane protein DedA with SNARE-associated domain
VKGYFYKFDLGEEYLAAILDQIRIWVEAIILALGYPGITLVMLIENLFPPIPSEVVMPFAGFLVADKKMTFIGIIAAGTLGAGMGAIIIYYIGMKVNEFWLRSILRTYGRYLLLSEKDLDKSLRLFENYGELFVLFGRVIPGIRSIISIPAGYYRMKFSKFIFYTLAGTIVWNLILATSGYVLGNNWEQVLELLSTYETIIYIVIMSLIAGFLISRIFDKQKNEPES